MAMIVEMFKMGDFGEEKQIPACFLEGGTGEEGRRAHGGLILSECRELVTSPGGRQREAESSSSNYCS
jgi:hypothetical protein